MLPVTHVHYMLMSNMSPQHQRAEKVTHVLASFHLFVYLSVPPFMNMLSHAVYTDRLTDTNFNMAWRAVIQMSAAKKGQGYATAQNMLAVHSVSIYVLILGWLKKHVCKKINLPRAMNSDMQWSVTQIPLYTFV